MDRNRKAAYQTLIRVIRDHAYVNIEAGRQIDRCKADSPAFTRDYAALAVSGLSSGAAGQPRVSETEAAG